jgi:hypothetical protein
VDKVATYRQIVERLIREYASFRPANGQIEPEAVIDRDRDHYEVMHVGWDGVRRVHGSVVHVDIIGGKIWIQYDGTSRPIADELLAAGVPREDIVLGFHPAQTRRLTEFAIG